ncbi:MAG TPA: GNAT family N-acetyltransferase [Devosia sp.]|uniref:GNAT family N-acetyltransferase n=1 Tax=Devosia sp. TaxID=1871048 RepID=UPI002F91FEA4
MTPPDLTASLAGHEVRRASVPILATERLLLRGHTADDFDSCCRLWSNPEVTRNITGRPSTPDETWRRMLAYAGHWSFMGFGYFLVTEQGTGAVVGEVGLADFRRTMTPSFGTTPEAGWIIDPQFQGRGLAAEAVSAVLAWAGQTMPRTVCLINPDNYPSLRLAHRLGYREYARTDGDHSAILLERPPPV